MVKEQELLQKYNISSLICIDIVERVLRVVEKLKDRYFIQIMASMSTAGRPRIPDAIGEN